MTELFINRLIMASLSGSERVKAAETCPFNAIEVVNDSLHINSACKMCRLCVKNGPSGLFEIREERQKNINKNEWQGIAVYIDHFRGAVHPVSLELIAKAKELASSINRGVYALFIGKDISEAARELLHYGTDKVYVYSHPALEYFSMEPYVHIFEDFINQVKPSSILVGATQQGRSLAPRVAARFRTGLTADCTVLEMKENSDLVQIRPAFGGNIMAQIITPSHRPQLATVRYKIFNARKRSAEPAGEVFYMPVKEEFLTSRARHVAIIKKESKPGIAEAEAIVACGRGFRAQKDLQMAYRLAELLDAEIACTRPMIEAGWIDASRQIGLSGRTVKPKLLITLGISGAVQFKAGMENAEAIFAVNSDPKAPIFDVCHYAVIGDIYEIVPKLIKKIENEGLLNV